MMSKKKIIKRWLLAFIYLIITINTCHTQTTINRNISLDIPNLTLEVKSNDVVISGNEFAYISAVPEMPNLRAKVLSSNNAIALIEIKIVFQYVKYYNNDISQGVVRNNTTSYPASGFNEIYTNNEWNINTEMGTDFRGGRATVTWRIKGTTEENTFVFHVRGTNPTHEDIKIALGTEPWFIQKLTYQESTFRQFNDGEPGVEWTNSGRSPNWGPPNGWGLMQRDPPPNETFLWNWRESIISGRAFLDGEKRIIATNRYNADMAEYYLWNQMHPEDQKNFHANQVEGLETFAHVPTGDERSFLDAMWIKSYNGNTGTGNGFYLQWKNDGVDATNPYWLLNRINGNNHNYVEAVCNRNP